MAANSALEHEFHGSLILREKFRIENIILLLERWMPDVK